MVPGERPAESIPPVPGEDTGRIVPGEVTKRIIPAGDIPARRRPGGSWCRGAVRVPSRFRSRPACSNHRSPRLGLLTVQEHTQALEDRLAAEGLGRLLPHRISSPTDDGAGSATYAKHAMEAVGLVPDTPFQMRTVRLRLQDAGHAAVLEVTNVHALPPVDVRVGQWRSDLAALRELIGRTESDAGLGPATCC